MKRALVTTLAKIDEAVDEVLYRPAVVRAFRLVPRWWLCDLAKLSIWLDDRWRVGYWDDAIVPGGACEACGRRAAIHVIGGTEGLDVEDLTDEEIAACGREVGLCGWCQVRGQILNEQQLQQALREATTESVSWHWRWRVRP
jgi:hypothetical protein